jgi:hypothetical protein
MHRNAPGVNHEFDGVLGIKRHDHGGMLGNREHAQYRDDEEPQQHHRPEGAPDVLRAESLRREQHDENQHRARHDERFQRVGGDVDAFERAQHRDRRRDDAIAIDQRGAEQSHAGQQLESRDKAIGADERHQRQNAALAVIIRAHHEEAVLDRNGDDQRPDDQRQNAECAGGRELTSHGLDHRLQRVQRTRAEVAEDDSKCRKLSPLRRLRGGGGCRGRIVDRTGIGVHGSRVCPMVLPYWVPGANV